MSPFVGVATAVKGRASGAVNVHVREFPLPKAASRCSNKEIVFDTMGDNGVDEEKANRDTQISANIVLARLGVPGTRAHKNHTKAFLL